MKKRAFLLLELLIGIFLIGLCAAPLARLPLRALREEIKSCYRLQLSRLADVQCAEIQAQLLRNEIPWEEISTRYHSRKARDLPPVRVSLGALGKMQFNCKYELYSTGKVDPDGTELRLTTLKISFLEKGLPLFLGRKKDRSTFTYQMLLKKNPVE
ncbi:MAG: hypothetical protein JSS61_04680 [Verrucomicrobia bacterium]|nr:hypothetical protein [Verrucomicrobiota bacterium]